MWDEKDEIYKAITTSDIAKYGVMNISTAERKVILRKADGSFNPLSGKEFTIFRFDGMTVQEDVVSKDSGVVWIGKLPFGTYYLHETDPDKWFTLTVGEDVAPGSRDGVSIANLTQEPSWYN